MSVQDTRQLLIDAALRCFAEQGVHNASLLEITRLAGQRNRGAVHYHFGSREGLLVEALKQVTATIRPRELELLERAAQRPEDDLASAVEVIVRPSVELSEDSWRGRCGQMILAEMLSEMHQPSGRLATDAVLAAGGRRIFGLMTRRMPPMDDLLRRERQRMMTNFVLRSTADRARWAEERPGEQLPTELFIANLLQMATAMLAAPVPPELTPDQTG